MKTFCPFFCVSFYFYFFIPAAESARNAQFSDEGSTEDNGLDQDEGVSRGDDGVEFDVGADGDGEDMTLLKEEVSGNIFTSLDVSSQGYINTVNFCNGKSFVLFQRVFCLFVFVLLYFCTFVFLFLFLFVSLPLSLCSV
jgi:hypothetical protein